MQDVTPESLQSEVRAEIDEARSALASFTALPPDADFGAVVLAFDRIRRPLNLVAGKVGLFSAVHPASEVRECAEGLERELVSFDTELSLDRRVYDRLATLDVKDAPGEREARLFEHALRDFRRSGVDKDEATRGRIQRLTEELVEIGQRFDRNIVQGARSIRIKDGHAGLAGMPEDFLAAHPEDDDGAVMLSTDMPDYFPFMMYADRGDLRERLYREGQNRAHPENLAVLDELIAKRFELARELGYGSWAEFITEDKMVKSAAAAHEFIERIASIARPRSEVEYAELLDEKRKTVTEATEVRAFEVPYLTEKVKRARFQFDSQSVRPYFAYEKVKQGVLSTSRALYGVDFRKNDSVRVWHPSVECYDVVDSGEIVARFYLDMFPREGKYKHAAMFDIHHGVEGELLPEAALVCNFPEPKNGDPALLLHRGVTTFFHEFGHLLHHLFGVQRYLKFSGITTEWDFVEVPSQMYEEWAWDACVLQRFATHHESGEAIPAELVRSLRAAGDYGKALNVMVQMSYAMLSLAYYEREPGTFDTTELLVAIKRRFLPIRHEAETYFQAAFGHLNGYGAIYYTYMWSLVIAKDLVSLFEGDLMNTETANRYRGAVLSPGGSRDAVDLVQGFLGRGYGLEAWEAWLAQ